MRKIIIIFTVILVIAATFTYVRMSDESKLRIPKTPIEGRYMVVLNIKSNVSRPEVDNTAHVLTSIYGGEVQNIYSSALKGYVVTMSAKQAETLSEDEQVSWVEQDSEVRVSQTQESAPWNLDRVDQRTLPLDAQYNYTGIGEGAHVYIVDTGIRVTHQEFGGRASVAYDGVFDGQNGNDCNGHGTHVAGTAVGFTYGIAKGARVYAVRVLNCSGTGFISTVVGGVDWITANRIDPAVANISLTAEGFSPTLESAIDSSVAQGVVYTVSAGNNAADACFYTPARTPAAITTGASWQEDGRAAFSNYGSCLDLFAPGNTVVSAHIANDTALSTRTGTSMSAPLVAGVAAVFRGMNPTISPEEVARAIDQASTMGILTQTGEGSPNKLLYSLLTNLPPPTPITPTPSISPSPSASPTASPSPSPSPTITPTPTPAPTPSATISGFVRRSDGRGIEDVTVRIQGPNVNKTTRTRSSGSYTFSRVALNFTYTLTPSRSGWTFTPTSQSIFITSNISNINFTGTR